MDFDFFDRSFLETSRKALAEFREAVEQVRPPEADLEQLCQNIKSYPHCKSLENEFSAVGVDGSGEFPLLQQDDVFFHLVVAAAKIYQTQSHKQNKLTTGSAPDINFRDYLILRDKTESLQQGYAGFLERLLGLTLQDLVKGSDYCEAYSQFGKQLKPKDISWDNFAFSRASQVATHAYQIRTLAELGVAIRMLSAAPKYLLLDTSLVYFLLGETPYLPELLKRYLVCQANQIGTCVIALSKSHNIPNGDLIGRHAREQMGLKDHWYLRLPSESLGETPLGFLREKEVPPKLCVSYLFKFHATSFPMRLDMDAQWWHEHVNHDLSSEQQLFSDLDFTCHDVRSYGYPYPMHAAHRTASLTKQEKKAIRDILMQNAKEEGLLRGAFMRDPESVHMEGM